MIITIMDITTTTDIITDIITGMIAVIDIVPMIAAAIIGLTIITIVGTNKGEPK